MLPVTILWLVAHVGSFAVLLIFQGWATALVAEFGLMLFGGIFPINYQSHLKRVYKHAQNLGFKESFGLQMAGVSTDGLSEIIGQAIEERRNPQQWWAMVPRDATQEMIFEE